MNKTLSAVDPSLLLMLPRMGKIVEMYHKKYKHLPRRELWQWAIAGLEHALKEGVANEKEFKKIATIIIRKNVLESSAEFEKKLDNKSK